MNNNMYQNTNFEAPKQVLKVGTHLTYEGSKKIKEWETREASRQQKRSQKGITYPDPSTDW